MALKSILLVFLVLAAAAAPIAVAQLGLLNGLLGLISIKGTVACSLGGGTAASGSALPVFPSKISQSKTRFLFQSFLYGMIKALSLG